MLEFARHSIKRSLRSVKPVHLFAESQHLFDLSRQMAALNIGSHLSEKPKSLHPSKPLIQKTKTIRTSYASQHKPCALQIKKSHQKQYLPYLQITRRSFHTSRQLQDDTHHLGKDGLIKAEIIEWRLNFLKERGLLQDKLDFEDRLLYQNKHLYRLHDRDKSGLTNLERMQKGNCPLCPNGDYITLHHLSQTHASDLIALTNNFHQSFHQELHSQVSLGRSIRVQRGMFQREKQRYWKLAAELELEPIRRHRKN